MKKQILSVALAVVMVVCLVGCDTTQYQKSSVTEDEKNWGHFTVISQYGIGGFGSY